MNEIEGSAAARSGSKTHSLAESLDRLLLSLNVNVAAVAVCTVARDWQMTIDPMDNPMLHYVLHGEGELSTGEATVPLAADSFVIVPADTEHRLRISERARQTKRALKDCSAIADGMLRMSAGDSEDLVTTCGAISATYGQSLGFFDFLDGPVVIEARFATQVQRAFSSMLEELRRPLIGTRAITSALMKQCIVLMVRSELDGPITGDSWLWTLRDSRLAPVIAAILDNPAAEHSVASLAKRAAMSRSAFSKRFTGSFGISPIDFVTRVRLNQSAHLLARTRLPIKVIAGSVGYSSRSYFSRAFRNRFGIDPTSFRKAHGRLKEEQSWRPLKALKDLFSDDDSNDNSTH